MAEPTGTTPTAVVTAVLDACVLFSATLRDTLLRAAAVRLYELYLTDTILEEVSRNVVRRGRMTEERAAHLVEAIRSAFPQALVTGFEHLVDQMTNDLKDRHVLAAAVAAGASIVVTHNVRDFPEAAMRQVNVEVRSPDDFLIELFSRHPERMIWVIQRQAAALRAPPMTVEEILDRLMVPAPGFAARIRRAINDRPLP